MGPAEQDAAWADTGVEGVHRFLARLWRLGDELGAGGGRSEAPGNPQGDELTLAVEDLDLHGRLLRVSSGVRTDVCTVILCEGRRLRARSLHQQG